MGPHILPDQIRSHRASRKTRQRSHHRPNYFDALESRTLLSTTSALDPSGRPTPSGLPTTSAAIFLSISSEATTYGSGVNLVARVLATGIPDTDGTIINFIDQQPTGNVILAAAPVQNNMVSFHWTNGSVGDHQVIAQVALAQTLPTTASEPMAISVAPASTRTILTVQPKGGTLLIAHVSAPINPTAGAGTVSFFEGTRALATAALSPNGTAGLSLAGLRTGRHAIVAAYNGCMDYSPSVSSPAILHLRGHDSSSRRWGWRW